MKKILIILALLLVIPLFADYSGNTSFLSTAISVAADTEKVIGVGIADHSIPLGDQSTIGITCIFTPAGTSTSTVDFYFQVSYDGGTNWALLTDTTIARIKTDTAAVTGSIVRVFYEVNVHGASHIRWSKVDNNDAVNALTLVNVILSY